MTVDLYLKYKDEDQAHLYPIAVTDLFLEQWAPRYERLKLTTLHLFSGGHSLSLEEVNAVLSEMRVFQGSINDASDLPSELKRFISGRAETIIRQLESAITRWDTIEEIFL